METIRIVKNEFNFGFMECLTHIFFEENPQILDLKLKYQFEKSGQQFEIFQQEDLDQINRIANFICDQKPDFILNDFIDMYAQ